MILGNTERGRRWRRNEDALSLLGNKLATDRHDIRRKHTEWALTVLENEAVEINEVPDSVGVFICYARDARTDKAVSDQDNVIELFCLNMIDDVRCECIPLGTRGAVMADTVGAAV
jgi:hypothetical protein